MSAGEPARRTLPPTMERTIVSLAVDAGHPAFEGHFPGRPMLPGVALLAEVLEAARSRPALAAAVGATPAIAVAKFLAPVLPGARLEIALWSSGGALAFEVRDAGRVAASGQFARAAAAPLEATP